MWRNHCGIEKALNHYCVHVEQLGNGVMALSRLGQPQRINRDQLPALDFPPDQKKRPCRALYAVSGRGFAESGISARQPTANTR
ncbi:hypothetical protein C4K37_2587 [Pseudomonas chlororaphis subsp. piscium]|nr:hypothetical protein C4K37_2587 [Pseudomonas chlororaphis subsp. piscium]AZC43519.1 hypothetical protein C4K36_2594 [Pseudomonas chlororaphis subsp. piscium]AZC69245.1 hypothetical protein C4K32_2583 [Pseudomonas chlororaphis subsp. piscium]